MSSTSSRGDTPQSADNRLAYLLFGATVVIWGTNWPIIKVGLTFFPPFWFGFLRVALGCVTLFSALLVLGRLRLPARQDLPVIFSVGFLQIAVFLALINLALPAVGAGRSSILAYTTPLWVVPGAILLLGERLHRLKLVGLLLGLLGAAILFNPFALDWADPVQRRGNLLLMLAAVAWAAAILHIRSRHWKGSTLELAPWQLLVASPPLLLGALLFDPPWTPSFSWEEVLLLLHNGVLATGFGYWCAFTVTRSLPAITTSLGFLAVPLVGVTSSVLALGETLTASMAAGLLAILLGVALVNLADLRS